MQALWFLLGPEARPSGMRWGVAAGMLIWGSEERDWVPCAATGLLWAELAEELSVWRSTPNFRGSMLEDWVLQVRFLLCSLHVTPLLSALI